MMPIYSEPMMQLHNLVKETLKAKAPALHKEMEAKGTLTAFVRDAAEEISGLVTTATQAQRKLGKWDSLGPMESAARMRAADLMNQEQALAEWVESLPAETSP
jgi:plasmid replication initiation protein